MKTEIPKPKKSKTALTGKTFSEAMSIFLIANCSPILPGGGEIGKEYSPFIESEIRIHLYANGGGYIHLIGKDSQTVDFTSMK